MSNYWRPDDIVQIGETKVEISSENGLSFTGGQKISLFIPPSVKFMDGKKSFLEFDLKLSLPTAEDPTLLQLDHAGAGVLFRNMRIYDGTRGNLIEEINEYAELVALKYDYDTDASKRNLRALQEGGTAYSVPNSGTQGNTKSEYTDTMTNPYFKRGAGKTSELTDSDFTTVKCCVPIHSGVFSGKIFPVMMSNGLYCEWDLMRPEHVIKQLDTAVKDRRLTLNPIFHSLNGSIDAPDTWADSSGATTFYLKKDNNLEGDDAVNRCPFVVGENISFIKRSNLLDATLDAEWIISEINASSNGLLEIVCASSITQSSGEAIDQEWSVYSRSVIDAEGGNYRATYTISNFNLVVHQVSLDPKHEAGMMAKVRQGGVIDFDIHSVTNYKNSLLASDRQTSFLVHAQNSRAKSILVCPTDSTVYSSASLISSNGTYEIANSDADITLNSNRSGYSGICDFLTSVQYVINGKLVPSRPISTKKCATQNSIDAFHIFELEKGLDNAGIVPRSFVKYLENWTLGRGFAIGSGAMDMRGKDLSVLLKYEEASQPTKPKMINSFVFHIRKLMLKGSGAVGVIQ
jgi:hypothetical protein